MMDRQLVGASVSILCIVFASTSVVTAPVLSSGIGIIGAVVGLTIVVKDLVQ